MTSSDPPESASVDAPVTAAPSRSQPTLPDEVGEGFRGLLAATRSIVGALDLDQVLLRLVEAARRTTGARYAALAVHGPTGPARLVLPVDAEPDALGPLTPLRTRGPGGGTPGDESLGVGVLETGVRAEGAELGRLYVAGPTAPDFPPDAADLLAVLATTAGIAVENANRHEESRRRQDWLLASSLVSHRLLERGDDERDVWRLIARTVRRLASAHTVAMVVPAPGTPPMLRVAVADGAATGGIEGMLYPRPGSLAGQAMEAGRSQVVDDGDRVGVRWRAPEETVVGPVMALPLQGEFGVRGAVVVIREPGRPAFSPVEVDMAEDFAAQAAVALEVADSRGTEHRLAALDERERIARDLHDHVIQRLFAAGLGLQSASASVENTMVRERLGRTVRDIDETIRQIRTSIFALQYAEPTASSLRASVMEVLAEVEPKLGLRPDAEFSGPLDTLVDGELVDDAVAVVRGVLGRLAQRGDVRRAQLSVGVERERLSLRVDAESRSGEAVAPALDELAERAGQGHGELTVGTDGAWLAVRWSVPLS